MLEAVKAAVSAGEEIGVSHQSATGVPPALRRGDDHLYAQGTLAMEHPRVSSHLTFQRTPNSGAEFER